MQELLTLVKELKALGATHVALEINDIKAEVLFSQPVSLSTELTPNLSDDDRAQLEEAERDRIRYGKY